MKRTYLLLITLFFVFDLSAQFADVEYVFSANRSSQLSTAIIVDSIIYIGGSDYSCKKGVVRGLDESSNLLFNASIFDESHWKVQDLEYHESVGILIGSTFWNIADDVGSEQDGVFVFGLDLEGNLLFTNLLDINSNDFISYGGLTGLTYTSDSSIVVSLSDDLIWFDKDGNFLDYQTIPANSNLQGIDIANDSILIAYSLSELFIMDHDGNIIQEIPIPYFRSIYVEEDTAYCLTDEGLIIYSYSDQTLIEIDNFLNNIEQPRGISGNSNYLFINEFSNINADYEKVIQLNKNTFELEDEFYFEQLDTRLFQTLATEEDLIIFGDLIVTAPLPFGQLETDGFVKSTPIAQQPQFLDYDISLSNFVIIDSLIPVDTIELDQDWWVTVFDSPYITFNLDVTNTGSFPINSFSLVSNTFSSFNCSISKYFNHFDSLYLLPGETITISDTAKTYSFWGYPATNDPVISLNAFAPHHRFESNLDDNYVVSQLAYLTSTTLPDFVEYFYLFPNPSISSIELNLSLTKIEAKLQLTILDPTGKQYLQKTIYPTGNKIVDHINIQNLPPGLYFLQLSSNEKQHVERFIIQR